MPGLFEVCTDVDSPLYRVGRRRRYSVTSFGLHNKYDMSHPGTNARIMKCCYRAHARPTAALMSPPCTERSPLQNLAKRTPILKRKLKQSLRRTRPIFRNTYLLSLQCLMKGIHVIVEQPPGCRSWTQTEWKHLDAVLPFTRTVLGCRVGLRAPDCGKLMSKAWKFKTSSAHVADALSGLDVCIHSCKHVPCMGKVRTDWSKFYTDELACILVDAVKTLPASDVATEHITKDSRATLPKQQANSLYAPLRWLPQKHLKTFRGRRWHRRHWAQSSRKRTVRKNIRLSVLAKGPRTTAPIYRRCVSYAKGCAGGLAQSASSCSARCQRSVLAEFGKRKALCKFCLQQFAVRH